MIRFLWWIIFLIGCAGKLPVSTAIPEADRASWEACEVVCDAWAARTHAPLCSSMYGKNDGLCACYAPLTPWDDPTRVFQPFGVREVMVQIPAPAIEGAL